MDGSQPHGERDVLLRERVSAGGLAAVRDVIGDRAVRLGLPGADVRRFVLAVNEAVTNAIRHATGAGEVVVWYDGSRLVAKICDEGPGIEHAPATATPPVEALGGRGLWLIHQLVDQVGIVNTPGGALVRLEVSCQAGGGR
jgi:anti-sigma regulatory factor (Ser/Thr protein kinase)